MSSLPSDNDITHETDTVAGHATTPAHRTEQLHPGFIRVAPAARQHFAAQSRRRGRWWLRLACDRVHGQIARCHPGV